MGTIADPICWVVIKNLPKNSVLEIKTSRHALRMHLTDPERGRVRIEADGISIPKEFTALILGTIMPGKEDKPGVITINQKMALMVSKTNPTIIMPIEIGVNGTKLLP